MKNIEIIGARVHNLKNIDVAVPKDKLVVITGISGSGKSSFVFDLLFEEGRRRYLQSVGMLDSLSQENKFDTITGIGPTVAIQQSIIRQSNPRSVVGSKTGILGYLQTLYAHEGETECSACGEPVVTGGTCSCGSEEPRLQPNYFSFNSPNGMCLTCQGRGHFLELNMQKLIPDDEASMRRILTGTKVLSGLTYLKRRFGEYINQPFYGLPEEVQEEFLYGRPKSNSRRTVCIYTFLAGHFSRGNDVEGRIELKTCPECQGEKICEEAREVSIRGKKIGQLGRMTLTELMAFMQGLVAQNHLSPFGENLAQEIMKKGRNLVQAGIGHLTSYRPMPGLSGGEVQRLFLTSHLDHQMDSLIYILDEPTVGLHEVEKADLMELIAGLKALGNSVIVVEHERNTIAHADHIIDFGPLAGARGGEIVYQGTYAGLLESPDSITGEYLSGRRVLPRKAEEDYEEINRATPMLVTRRVRTNNLKGITAEFPLGVLTGVAGVSGSGKSSLVSATLVPLLENHFAEQRARRNGKDFEEENGSAPDTPRPVADRLEGTEHITGFAEISQVPIGRHHNSNPVSYLGIWDSIRKVFAAQPLAKERGYGQGHFSFNSAGACPECRGSGYNRLWLGRSFVHYSCETCGGHRYLDDILEVTYEGANIVDILNMSVSSAVGLFRDPPRINAMLEVLQRVGMGYITLGQPAPTLSGGEAQRIKLAKEIGKMRRGHTLYVLDEPTTGLSLYDMVKLLKLLDELVEQGNSIIIIEHDPGVLSYCDWIIELGPGGGNNGGEIIAQGSPADLKRNPASITGPFLRDSADASAEKSTEISTETSDQLGLFK